MIRLEPRLRPGFEGISDVSRRRDEVSDDDVEAADANELVDLVELRRCQPAGSSEQICRPDGHEPRTVDVARPRQRHPEDAVGRRTVVRPNADLDGNAVMSMSAGGTTSIAGHWPSRGPRR